MSDVSPLSGISGLSFDSPFLSPLMFFFLPSPFALTVLSYFLLMVHYSQTFFFNSQALLSVNSQALLSVNSQALLSTCPLPLPLFSVIVLRCVPVQQLWGYESQLPVF